MASSSIDKSKVWDVKPLRSLKPVFPSSPQGASSPFGPFPSGFSPFYPFSAPHESQISPDQSEQTTPTGFANQRYPMPAPVRSYRTPKPVSQPPQFSGNSNGNTGSSMENPTEEESPVNTQKRARKSKGKSKGSSKLFEPECSSFQRDDGNRESFIYVLVTFDALRRRLSQVEDAKESTVGIIKRADLKCGNILMSKGVRTNMRKRFGEVPGVEIGDIFFFRMEMCLVGLHSQSMAGIDYVIDKGESGEEPLAISIVSSGGYDDEVEDRDVLIYSGQGGNINKKDKEVADQKLERGNLALERSLRRGNDVRVIRGMRDTVNPSAKVYVYDGLFTIQESWMEKGKTGCSIFKYKLVRIPGQPDAFSLWKSIQKWKEGFASRAGLILPDLTSGAETIPVSLVNDVDHERGPGYFTYFPTVKYSKSFNITQPSFGCNCHKACRPGDLNCSCIQQNGGDFPYVANSILVSRKPLLHECGPTCPCFPDCKNRVSQTGLKVHLEVFKTTDRGWGLRSWDPIRAGTFICEYAGEVVDISKVKQDGFNLENNDYVFNSTRVYDNSFKWNYEPTLLDEETSIDANEDYNMPSPLIINAKNMGNVARFMNHSCSPNVFWQPVLYEHNSESFLHIAFYAIKHIPPMTELTYDYGISSSENFGGHRNNLARGKKICLCGSSRCRGYFG